MRQKSSNPPAFADGSRADGRRRLARQKVRGDGGEVLVFELGGSVHPAHRCIVDRAFEFGERGPRLRQALRKICSIQKHRIVAREILAVVLEHGQAVLVELGVGRVDVDRVDLVTRNGFISEPVIEAARCVEGQLVRALQSGPAVGAPDEFLRQSEPHVGMRLEVGQPHDIPGTRIVGAHRQCVGIVETQRNRDRQPHGRQLGVEFGERRNAVEFQDFLGDRARVFGVDVDAAGRERVQYDGRIAQSLAVRRACLAGGLSGLPQDLAQDVRLGEALGADAERRCCKRDRGAGRTR